MVRRVFRNLKQRVRNDKYEAFECAESCFGYVKALDMNDKGPTNTMSRMKREFETTLHILRVQPLVIAMIKLGNVLDDEYFTSAATETTNGNW